jgi:general secretion pathway protein I
MRSRGFTLLEVMVAISILALALVAIAGINATSFESSNYAKHLTVATLLARSKMIDVEELLRKDGFGSDEQSWDGDFSEEGYPGFKWKAVARPVEVDVGQLLGGFLGGDEEVSSDKLPEEMQAFLGALNGEIPAVGEDATKYVEQVGGSELSQLLGGEQMELIFKQVGETLGNSIREITLEIEWGREGIDLEKVKFVQYVTTTGRLTFPPPGAAASQPVIPGLPQQPGGRNPATGGFLPDSVGGFDNPAKEPEGGGK